MKQCQPVSAIANETEEKKTREWPRVRIACVAAGDISKVAAWIAAVLVTIAGLLHGTRWMLYPVMSDHLRDGPVFMQYFASVAFLVPAVALGGLLLLAFREWWPSVKKRAAGR